MEDGGRELKASRQVHLVQDDEAFLAREFGKVISIGFRPGFGIVEDMENEFRLFQSLATPANAFDFYFIARLTQPSRINEYHRQPANVGGLFDGVARGAGNGRDDGAVMPEKLIEQAGFAGVGPANDGGANAAAQDLAFRGGAQQFVHESYTAFKPANQLGAGVGRDVFIWKVNVSFNMGEGFEHLFAQLIYP